MPTYFKTDNPELMIETHHNKPSVPAKIVKAIAGLVFSPIWVPVWLLGQILAVKPETMSVDTTQAAHVFDDQN